MHLLPRLYAVPQDSAEFQMQRYFANNNRIMGGLVLTIQRYKIEECASQRFASLRAQCLDTELKTESFGLEAVSEPAEHTPISPVLQRLTSYHLNPGLFCGHLRPGS